MPSRLPAASAPPPASAAISQLALNVFSSLLEVRTGQQIAAYRSWRIDTALKPLLRARGLGTLDQLVALLLDRNDQALGDQIVDALVNGETSFFREAPVFDLVVEAVEAIEASGRHPRIWCAGCSSGQEPLSLAMLFAERAHDTGVRMPDIVATDVSEVAVARTRAGRYSQFEIQRGLPIRRMMRWFDAAGDDWAAKPELLRAITVRRHNLAADPAPGQFDILLCRNVLLYFSPQTKGEVFGRFARALRPGGMLVLGAGETVIGQTDAFVPSRTLRGLYERVTGPAAGIAAA
ncbi:MULTISPECIES: protein-glutamate O-methyltransferase CheR [unclassified Sphingomonas]|jgi:chemotaxis protein methyltransferase CheR|uniref:CheR family methyltransferase n=1 Tax=unclassified Sphingomonas TaxID=196159 RepID=UPI000E10ACD5|nr:MULTISPECIES: protein-glutamate O-methyltransferase CheR [unclassified Sphingomonas]AXJ94239.1 chemotaxis protein CheR [Sphingomonas sp. FARSPH]